MRPGIYEGSKGYGRSMRRRLCGFATVVAAFALSGGALAVTGGTPDPGHAYVGAAIQAQVHGGQAGTELCSGFLISATKFVTAAHCFDPSPDAAPIILTFDHVEPTGPGVLTAINPAPGTAAVTATLDDIAVLTLSQPVVLNQYAVLPTPGLAQSVTSVDVVGYGIEGFDPKKIPTGFGVKMVATTPVKSAGNLSDVYLKLLAGPGGCFGDSGGPNFAGGTTDTVVAITSAGLKNCNGISLAERIDTPAALDFLTRALS